jgi:hypothetical protein
MKNMTRILVTMTLTLLPMLAAAQLQPDTKLVAQVPFDFMIGGKAVPAGTLSIQRAVPGSATLSMRNRDANVNIFCGAAQDESKTPAAANTLVFNKYGHHYFLAQVKIEGSKTKYKLPQSPAEAEFRAQNSQAPQEVLLARK